MKQRIWNSPTTAALALFTLSTLNLLAVVYRLHYFGINTSLSHGHGYIGYDFPENLPPTASLSSRPVLMTVEDTVHYPLTGLLAQPEWDTIYPTPIGFVRLGPNKRIMSVSMLHQLHCVEKMRRALDNPDDQYATIPHLQHCMNYIRQMILCASDLTLEPEGSAWHGVNNSHSERGPRPGVGVTHVCRNWEEAYAVIESNFVE